MVLPVEGVCFVCGGRALVEENDNEPTGFDCARCDTYDLVEEDRSLFEEWLRINPEGRRPRLMLAVSQAQRPLLNRAWLQDLVGRLDVALRSDTQTHGLWQG